MEQPQITTTHGNPDTSVGAQNSTESAEGATVDFNSKEQWGRYKVAKILHVDADRLDKLAQPHLQIHPEWLIQGAGSAKNGVRWHKDLVILLEKEERENREIPKDWKTVDELVEITGGSIDTIRNVLRAIVKSFPDAKNNIKTINYFRYYSPEICNAVVEQLRLYPFIPEEYRTIEQLAIIQLSLYPTEQLAITFPSVVTKALIPDIIKALKIKGKIKGKFFTRSSDGLVVECFPRETAKIIHDFLRQLIKKTKVSKGEEEK